MSNQNISQLRKYKERRKNLFILGGYHSKEVKEYIGINSCLDWNDLVNEIKKYKTESNSFYNYLVDELIDYLSREGLFMKKEKESPI